MRAGKQSRAVARRRRRRANQGPPLHHDPGLQGRQVHVTADTDRIENVTLIECSPSRTVKVFVPITVSRRACRAASGGAPPREASPRTRLAVQACPAAESRCWAPLSNPPGTLRTPPRFSPPSRCSATSRAQASRPAAASTASLGARACWLKATPSPLPLSSTSGLAGKSGARASGGPAAAHRGMTAIRALESVRPFRHGQHGPGPASTLARAGRRRSSRPDGPGAFQASPRCRQGAGPTRKPPSLAPPHAAS